MSGQAPPASAIRVDIELDEGSCQPADLVTGRVLVHGEGTEHHQRILVGLFANLVGGGVADDVHLLPLRPAAPREVAGPFSAVKIARFVLPVPAEISTGDEASCVVLARLGPGPGVGSEAGPAAEEVAQVVLVSPSQERIVALQELEAAVQLRADAPGEALRHAETAAASLTRYAPAHILLGDLRWAVTRDAARARAAFDQARASRPHDLDAGLTPFRFAEHAAARGDLTEALAHLEEAVTIAPDNGDYHEALSAVQQRTGDMAGAEQSLLAALARRDSVGALRGLLNLYDAAERWDDLLSLGDRFYAALFSGDAATGAHCARVHCEYFYLLARAGYRRGFKGAAMRWLRRYFEHFDPGERGAGTFSGSPFAQHGDEEWFDEIARRTGFQAEADPYMASVSSQQRQQQLSDLRRQAPSAPVQLASGIVLAPRFFEKRDPEALRRRWSGEPRPVETPVFSRAGAAGWDTPIFDPALRELHEPDVDAAEPAPDDGPEGGTGEAS